MPGVNTLSSIYKRIPTHMLVALSAWTSRIIIAVVQLFSVRILIESLGAEQYAAFALLTGLMGWYMLADVGIGVSLQNFISEQRAKGQLFDKYLSVAAMVAVMLLMLTILLLYFISPYLAPVFLKHFNFISESEKVRYFFVVGALFIGASIGGIVYKVWYAQQRGYLSNIVPALASLIALAGIWLVAKSETSQNLFWSLVAFIAPTAALALISFITQITTISAKSWQFDFSIFNKIMARAGYFWFFGLMAAGVLQIDYIVMSQFVMPREIVVYNISTKVYSLVFFVYNAVLMALWPVCTEMITRREWQRVKVYLKRYLTIGIAFMSVSILLIAWLMPDIVEIISPGTYIVVPMSFIFLLGSYQLIRIWTDTFAMVLQSMSEMKPFLMWVPVQVILSVLLQWGLAPQYGIFGIVLGLIGSFVLTVMWALPCSVYRQAQLAKGGTR